MSALLAVAALLVACGTGATQLPAPPLPRDALPELRSSSRILDPAAMAEDALDPDTLRSLLEDAGFVTGRERSFSGRIGDLYTVVARVLVFEYEGGAATYLRWVEDHAGEILGTSERREPLAMEGAPHLFASVRSGCCPKEVPAFLAAWRRGTRVLWLLVAGPGADRAIVASLAALLDEAT